MNNWGPSFRLVRQKPNQNPLETGRGLEQLAKNIFFQMCPFTVWLLFLFRAIYTLQLLFSLHPPSLSLLDTASLQHQTLSLKDFKRLENAGRVPVHGAASSSLCISTYFMFNNSIELHLKFTWKISEKHQIFLRDIIFLLLTMPKKDPSCWDFWRVLRQVLPCWPLLSPACLLSGQIPTQLMSLSLYFWTCCGKAVDGSHLLTILPAHISKASFIRCSLPVTRSSAAAWEANCPSF